MKKFLALILSLMVFLSFGITSFAEEEYSKEEQSYDITLQLIKYYGITEKDQSQILEEALLNLAKENTDALYKVLNAIAKTVDEYSVYYSEEEWQEFSKSVSGTVYGIGVSAIVNDGCFEVVTALEGGSAIEAGIAPGDIIIEADGVDITGAKAENATAYITGEIGTYVNIKVKKANGEIKEYTLERREVIVPSIASTELEGNIGYILINSFTNNTATEVEKIAADFKSKNIEKLIIDLRNNGGGVMESGINTAKLFMQKDKTVISTKEKTSAEPTYYKTEEDGFKFNIVLLTNEYTASAAEIMACALIENGYAVSVGNSTFGKACGQAIYPLGVGGALRITILNYYTPNGNDINKTGIPATHKVDNEKYKLTEEELPKLSYSLKFNIGDTHEDIEKIETMLYNLNYLRVEPDNNFDESTKSAVAKFQEAEGLFPYGVCDLTTQSYLISRYSETEFTRDSQLDYARTLLN